MAHSGDLSKIMRFGAFEVDLDAGEIRKQGLRLRIQEQPFQVLAALLEAPGEVVPREVLVRRLWPDGTVVDFDRGLNAAVTRLRQVLNDSAETPALCRNRGAPRATASSRQWTGRPLSRRHALVPSPPASPHTGDPGFCRRS